MAKVIFLLIFLVLILPIFWTCSSEKDQFEIIKDFRPDDKYFTASLKSLHFIIETSDITRVDTTFSLLIKHNGLPLSAKDCPDGNFIGESPYDAYDYKHVIKLEIKNQKIISVDYNEVHKNGIGKEEDEDYNKEMSVSGTNPAIAYPNMERQLINKQNLEKLDAVSGATYSLYRFRYAGIMALIQAQLKK